MGFRYPSLPGDLMRVRASLQQYKKTYYTGSKLPRRRDHRGIRVLEGVVGQWASAASLKEGNMYIRCLFYSLIHPISAPERPPSQFGRCYTH
jgi:hypothetical protein